MRPWEAIRNSNDCDKHCFLAGLDAGSDSRALFFDMCLALFVSHDVASLGMGPGADGSCGVDFGADDGPGALAHGVGAVGICDIDFDAAD